jgi:hypothetical protein
MVGEIEILFKRPTVQQIYKSLRRDSFLHAGTVQIAAYLRARRHQRRAIRRLWPLGKRCCTFHNEQAELNSFEDRKAFATTRWPFAFQ